MFNIRQSSLRFVAILALIAVFAVPCQAGITDSLDVKLRAGYHLGGTSPLPLPATIRSIDAFRPTVSVRIGADATLMLANSWGLTAGLFFEGKGMDGEVTVKGYSMEMKKGNSQISGLFTGHVKQEVSQWMLTLPVKVCWQLSEKVVLKGGPYVSLLVSKGFNGTAFDGYLRQGSPTGSKIKIGNKEGEWATYDFSDNMRSLQWGVSVGVDWQISGHVGLSADLDWGLSGLFQSDFKTVEQTLYPIFGCVGVFYNL